MSTSTPLRLLPGAPRPALAVVVLAALATAASPLLPPGGRALPVLVLVAAVCAVLGWRVTAVPDERAVWSRLALGAVAAGAVVAVGALLGALLPASDAGRVVSSWAPLFAFPLIYVGLVRWNRYSTSLADPHDLINGLSAVLAVVAVADLLTAVGGGPLAGLPWWMASSALAAAASGFVLLGTALSVASLGAMHRDPRTWLVVGVCAGLLTVAVARAAGAGVPPTWSRSAVALAAVCLAAAAVLRPTRTVPQPAGPAESTVGAFVVIVAATVTLVAAAATGTSGTAVWCAGLAGLGAGTRLLVNVRDLASLAYARREAATDELTGLANRRAVLRRLAELRDAGTPHVFALLDLDRFKEVNDGLGHAAGDQLLRQVAARLEPVLRDGDLIGRLGGDEFAVVALVDPGTPPQEVAAALCRRVHERLAAPFLLAGMSVHVGASIGTSASNDLDGDQAPGPARLLRRADAAMYDAKRSRTRSTAWEPARHADSSSHLVLVEELRDGIAGGRLVLLYQPQVDVVTGRTVGVEALVRWAHPRRGLLGPAEFLPLAEEHGLMGAVTDAVLTRAVAQAGVWRARGLDLRISVNLSASNLLDVDLPARLEALLRAAGVPSSVLTLEVTESVLISDSERSLAVVRALTALGTDVAIDDYGTGWSSLTYLRHLPVAELKLDRSYTADLCTDPRAAAIVASTIDLAHRLGLRVVAEGVEDTATLAQLAVLGCDVSQGYLHSRPLPAAELELGVPAAAAVG